MTDIERRERLAGLETKRTALTTECEGLAAQLPSIRAAFGNPFSYSLPEHPDEGNANFSGYNSHAVLLPTFLELRRVMQEIEQLKAEIAASGLATG